MIAQSWAKSVKKLKLRIRQNAFNKKVAHDQMKNKSFYQTFWKSQPFSFKGNRDDNSEKTSEIDEKFKIESSAKRL